jgi:hypothetical protein
MVDGPQTEHREALDPDRPPEAPRLIPGERVTDEERDSLLQPPEHEGADPLDAEWPEPEEWYAQLPPDKQQLFEERGYADSIKHLYDTHLRPNSEGEGDAESSGMHADLAVAELFKKAKQDKDLKEFLTDMPGATEKTMWDEMEAMYQTPEEREAAEAARNDPEPTPDQIAKAEAAVGKLQGSVQKAVENPHDAARVAEMKGDVAHIREHDGKFAETLKKRNPTLYRILVALLIVFYLYVIAQSAAASLAKAYGSSGSGGNR